jgi:phosphoglycolate phosphatase
LLDTLDGIAASANAALRAGGFPVHPREAYKAMVGEGRDNLARLALPEGRRDPETVTRLVQLYEAEYAARWREGSRPYAGVPEMLDTLTARKIRLAVLSNKPHDYTGLMVGERLAKWRFAVIRGARPDTPRKPHPEPALLVARRLRVEPSACLFLGDSGIDMKTARAAGMYAVGALWGYRGAGELRAAGAEALIERPDGLPALLPA